MNSGQAEEQNHPKIVKTIFILDKTRRYSFDVNQNIKINLLKRMIDAAANLNRAHLRIFHEGKEYTSYDESSLDILFPDLNIIIFNLSVSFDSLEVYDDLISLKLNKEYCPIHFSKYPYFYCFTCGKSICFECVKSNEHKGHNYKEKYDYLQSGEKLVNEIFKNVKDNFSEKGDIEIYSELRDKIKITFFSKLKQMIEEIEKRLVEVLDVFIKRNKKNIEVVRNNMISLKKNCGEGLDELKEKICIEDMMLDEEIFLTFDKKFKDLKNEKDKIIKDMEEYNQFKQQLKIISDSVEKIYNEIYAFLDKYLTSDIYMKIMKDIEALDILPLNKKDIIYRILSDVKKKPNLRSTKKKILAHIEPIKEEKEDSDNMQIEKDVKKNLLEEKMFSLDTKYVCQPIEKSNKILVYDVEQEKVLTKTFNNNLFISEFPENSAWINYKNNLYISGGEIQGRVSKNLLKYDPDKNKLEIICQIPDNKEFHSMCCDENDNIFLIGGLNNTVLKYNIETQKWTTFKNKLNMQRFHPICLIKENELFIFFGSDLYGGYVNTYEKTNLNGQGKFILYNPEQLINLEYSATLETVENSILFFGGKNDKGPIKTCLKFDGKTQKFEECPYMLNEPSSFHQNFLNQIGDNCFGYFSLENNNFVKINFNYNN
jgi:hypothetical protein